MLRPDNENDGAPYNRVAMRRCCILTTSMLILFAPGAPREPYFEQVAGMAGRSEEERAEFFLRHDTFWV